MTTLPILFPSLSPSNSITSRSPSPFLHIQTLRFCSVKSIQKNTFTSTSRIFYKFPSSIFPAESQDEDEEDDEDDDDDDEEAAEEYDEVYAEVSDGDEDSEDELESSVSDEMLNIEESRRQRVEKLRNEVREFGDGIIDVNELASIYSFRIDKFQRLSIQAFLRGSSVVVSAPTSSGKTLIAEAAAVATVARGRRLFYTTPLKALSNQKFREFCETFGESNVGLLTGDSAVNRDAQILIMTTEILRNMLYQSVGIASSDGGLLHVDVIVLDEVHYLSDISRGTVWEEIVIYCPKEVQLICLSATVANPDELAGWIGQIHGRTELVTSSKRPVPLTWHFSTKTALLPLLDDKGTSMNRKLSLNYLQYDESGSELYREEGSKRRKSRRRENDVRPLSKNDISNIRRSQVPQIIDTLWHLKARDMLPAVWFIFSRKGCDAAVQYLEDCRLLDECEMSEVELALKRFRIQYPDAVRVSAVKGLRRGVAAHHAGCLPLWKSFIEELFQRGLVKVVFATETLAAGINMPARTAVISSLSKRGDIGRIQLSSNELFQMAGRAGRRGIDEKGHVVLVQTPYEGPEECCKVLFSGLQPLVSQFTASYGMVLNLVAAEKRLRTELRRKMELERVSSLKPLLKEIGDGHLPFMSLHYTNGDGVQHLVAAVYLGKVDTLNTEKLKSMVWDNEAFALKTAVENFELGDNGGEDVKPSYHVALGSDNSWYLFTEKWIRTVYRTGFPNAALTLADALPREIMAELLDKAEMQWQKLAVSELGGLWCMEGSLETWSWSLNVPVLSSLSEDDEVLRLSQAYNDAVECYKSQRNKVSRCKKRIARTEGFKQYQKIIDSAKFTEEKIRRLNVRSKRLIDRVEQIEPTGWKEFLQVSNVIHESRALDINTHVIFPLGETAAAIRGENELWLAMVLRNKLLLNLKPAQLAAVLGSLVSEGIRLRPWKNNSFVYEPSTTVLNIIDLLEEQKSSLLELQEKHGVNIPCCLDSQFTGMVEAWASGLTWKEIMMDCAMDEGDLARLLRRTIDLLAQVPKLPDIDPLLQINAKSASNVMDRPPISELAG
ncbi:DExH-box ATP-dependent RNA helicase DExH15 chloroplastic isoform X2 [Solanum pennellii]|uniref:DExH-box ATP-dependent RNA helicase DExH15 chloroplastic isoform X2 n=1 Tax=Solanum pennellii TaxID=28526 RepID=A0ABM1VAU0_SOLPN|nr:DExH-box ATP-dependent RNA helicase DExH15 chloroplastic isoform X2 [Solanum pennellii]